MIVRCANKDLNMVNVSCDLFAAICTTRNVGNCSSDEATTWNALFAEALRRLLLTGRFGPESTNSMRLRAIAVTEMASALPPLQLEALAAVTVQLIDPTFQRSRGGPQIR